MAETISSEDLFSTPLPTPTPAPIKSKISADVVSTEDLFSGGQPSENVDPFTPENVQRVWNNLPPAAQRPRQAYTLDNLPPPGPYQDKDVGAKDVMTNKPAMERGTALAESMQSGMLGVAPAHPELQSKFPVQSFVSTVLPGAAAYTAAAPARLAAFAGIPAMHEIVRQATDTSAANRLNYFQRASKVATAGYSGTLTGMLFGNAALGKTILSRLSGMAGAGASGSFVNSLAQDVESGQDPDLKAAIVDAGVNAATIALFGAVLEFPSLRGSIMSEAKLYDPNVKDIKQAKSILADPYGPLMKKMGLSPEEQVRIKDLPGGTNPEAVSPTFQTALAGAKSESVIKSMLGGKTDLGVNRNVVVEILKDKSYSSQTGITASVLPKLERLDQQIFNKIKKATGADPIVSGMKTGTVLGKKIELPNYTPDYSKMNKVTSEQVQNLILLRDEMLAGKHPVDVLWRQEVAKKLNTKQVIQEYFDKHVRDVKAEHKTYIKANETPKFKESIAPVIGTIDAIGPKGAESTQYMLSDVNVAQDNANLKYLESALASLAENPSETRAIPDATQMDDMYRYELLRKIQLMHESGKSEPQILEALQEKLSNSENNPYEVSILSAHQGKEASPDKAMLYDRKNMRTLSIEEFAQSIKELNDKRKLVGLPDIKPDDVIFHRRVIFGQKKGIEKQVRSLFLDKYRSAKTISPISSEDLFGGVRIQEPNPTLEPTGMITPEIIAQVGKQAQDNIAAAAPPEMQSVVAALNDYKVAAKDLRRAKRQEPRDLERATAAQEEAEVNLRAELDASFDQGSLAEQGYNDIWENRNITQTELTAEQANAPTPEIKTSEELTQDLVVSKISEQKEQEEIIREVVENSSPGNYWLGIARELTLSLGRVPTPQEMADLANKDPNAQFTFTEEDVRNAVGINDLANSAGYIDASDVSISKVESDVPLELRKLHLELQDWYNSLRGVSDQGVIDDMVKQTLEDYYTTKKASKESYADDDAGVSHLYRAMEMLPVEDKKKELVKFFKKAQKDDEKKVTPVGLHPSTLTDSQIKEKFKNVSDFSKALDKYRPYINEEYLARIKDIVEEMSSDSKKIAAEALMNLSKKSTSEEISVAAESVKEQIDLMDESVGLVNNKYQGESSEGEVEFDEEFEKNDTPFDLDERGSVLNPMPDLSAVGYNRFKKKIILQYNQVEREAPIMLVLKTMRDHPYVYDLRKHWKTNQTIKSEDAQARSFFKVPDDIYSKMWDTKVYEDAIRDLALMDLQPIHDDVLKNVQDFIAAMGIKGPKKKEVYQPIFDEYAHLMSDAAEQVLVKSWDPNAYGYSKLGLGPHESAEETNAYVQRVKEVYEKFRIPVSQQIPEGVPDPTTGEYPQGTLRHSRTPIFWELLVNPLVMNNNSLCKAILFYKAQIELPLLEEQVRLGIYANADIYQNITEGYTKHGFAPEGAQIGQPAGFKRPGTASIQRPKRSSRSLQEHVAKGNLQGWAPISDFFNNGYDYMSEAMKGIKQAQLHKELASVRMPHGIEYADKDFIAANAKTPSPHEFFWVQHETDANIIDEAKRMSVLLKKEVHPMDILAQGGWIKGNADDGLNKWYRGSFQPPFIYRSLYNQIRTLWRPHSDFDQMGSIARLGQKLKFTMLSLPTDSAAQYLGNIFLERPMWKVVPYMAMLPVKTGFYAAKGLLAGKDIASGKYSYQVGKTPHQISWNKLFLENGMVATAGYKSYLNNLIDKTSPGLFTQRQDKLSDVDDYMMSILGMNQAIMGEMIAQDVLNAAIAIAENKVSEGMSVPEAASFTAHYINSSVYQLNRNSWKGPIATHLRNLTWSRNFVMTPFRMMMIMSRRVPGANSLLKKAGAYNYKTEDGGGKESWNVLMGNDIPERFMPSISWKWVSMFTKMAFLALVVKGMLQMSFQLANGKDPSLPIDNPDGAKGMIRLGWYDINGNELFLDSQLFKSMYDLTNLTSTIVDPAVQGMTGMDDFHSGKGALAFVSGKMGSIFTMMELFGLKLNDDGTSVYDNSGTAWENAGRFVNKLSEFTPINPFVGTAAPKVPYNRDPLVDLSLRSMSMLGINIKAIKSDEMQKLQRQVRSEEFKQAEERKGLDTEDALRKAKEERKISSETFKNKMMEIRAQQRGRGAGFFKKKKIGIIRDAERRK